MRPASFQELPLDIMYNPRYLLFVVREWTIGLMASWCFLRCLGMQFVRCLLKGRGSTMYQCIVPHWMIFRTSSRLSFSHPVSTIVNCTERDTNRILVNVNKTNSKNPQRRSENPAPWELLHSPSCWSKINICAANDHPLTQEG